jgi:hypothetical protein
VAASILNWKVTRPIDLHTRAAANPELVARVAELLTTFWDPAHEFDAPDGSSSSEAHARAVLGVLAAGGPAADVMGYLRRAEEGALGAPRTTGRERWAIATVIERWSWGREALPAHGSDAPVRALFASSENKPAT